MLRKEFNYGDKNNGKKWVSYFDILGFRRECQTNNPSDIFSNYIKKCLEELTKRIEKQMPGGSKIESTFFSDSFIIYTSYPLDEPDDRVSFGAIEQASRLFVEILIQEQIPFRGAMSCDEFYADKTQGVFFGKALVEAYELAESCDWLGFVLCPSAICRMKDEGCPIDEYDGYRDLYKQYDIPMRKKVNASPKSGMACLLSVSLPTNRQNKLLHSLEEMKARAKKPEHKAKYDNTLNFLATFNVIPSS